MVKPIMESLMKGDLNKVGYLFASELVKDEGSPKKPVPSKKDPKREALYHAAHFAQGFLKGAKVGDFDVRELAECIAHEPKTEKMLAISNKEVYESFKFKRPEEGAKGLAEAAEAMVEMVKETAHKTKADVDKDQRPICAKLFFDKKRDWNAAATFEKEVFDEATTIKWEKDHMIFNHQDITALGEPLEKAITTGDYGKAGWLLASTLVKEEGPVSDRKKEGLEAAAEFA